MGGGKKPFSSIGSFLYDGYVLNLLLPFFCLLRIYSTRTEDNAIENIKKSEVRVVTFDLDNTLWNTAACIDAANSALAAFLAKDNIQQPKRVEIVMGELFRASKSRYAPIDGEAAKSPVLLTQLRTDAVCQVLVQDNGYNETDALEYSQRAFDLWTKARHEAIPNCLASHVIPTLQKIASIRTSTGHPVLIGAITDGNSDPRNVDILSDFFDFCVNAEQVGVGKPDKRVYLKAIRHVIAQPQFQDLLLPSNVEFSLEEEEEKLESLVGSYWVHVGDDFIKDIVAAKDLKMRSIWATELIRDKLVESVAPAQESTAANPQSERSGKKVEEFVKEVSKMKLIVMPIGADNYLADTIQKEFVDGVAEKFSSIASILMDWHGHGLAASQQTKPVERQPTATVMEDFKSPEILIFPSEKATIKEDIDTDNPLSVVMPAKFQTNKGDDRAETRKMNPPPRVFRLVREDTNMDVPAPILARDTMTMKPVMELAQMDKSSGVFSFPVEDIRALREGKMVLMVDIADAGVQFSRDVFLGMTVQDVLSFTDENPVTLSLSLKKAATSGFDIF
jgi:FMN hydrolase / 5-amino-6-(5-phospho-D-ribitylamino)uracil phosphatase